MKKAVILASLCNLFFLGTVTSSKLPLPQPPIHQDSHKAALQQSTSPKSEKPSTHTTEQGFPAKQAEFHSQSAKPEQQEEHARTAQKNKDGREEVVLDSEASSTKGLDRKRQTHSSSQDQESQSRRQEEPAKKSQESKSKQDSDKEKNSASTLHPKNLDEAFAALGISKNASEREIELAYKKLALKSHPDKNPNDPEATKKFQELGAARDLIKKMKEGIDPAKSSQTNYADMTKEDRRSVIIAKGNISPDILAARMRAIHESLPLEQQVKEIKESINIKSDDKNKLFQDDRIKNNEAVKASINEEKLKENTQLIDHIQAKINESGLSMGWKEKAALNIIMNAAFEKSYAIDAQIRRLERPNASLADAHQQILDADKILNEAHAKFFPKMIEQKTELIAEQKPKSGVKPSDRSQIASGKNLSTETGAMRGRKMSAELEKISQESEQQKLIALAESSELSSKSLSRVKTVIENANKKYQEKIDEINNSSSTNEEKAAQIKIAKEKLSEKMDELHSNIKKASEQEKAERIKEAESVKPPKINKEEDHRLNIKNLENEEERLRKQYEDIGRSQNIGRDDETRENFYNYFSIEKSNLNDRLKEIAETASKTKMPEKDRLALEKTAREEHVKALQGTLNMHLSLQEAIKNKVGKEQQSYQQQVPHLQSFDYPHLPQQPAQPFQPTFHVQQEKPFQPTFHPQQPVQPFQPTFHPQQPAQPFQPTFQPKKQTSQERVDKTNEKITQTIDVLKKKKLVSKGDEKLLMKKWNDLERAHERRSRSVANSKQDQKTKDSQQRKLDASHANALSEFQKKLQENPKSLLKKKSRMSRIKSAFKRKKRQ